MFFYSTKNKKSLLLSSISILNPALWNCWPVWSVSVAVDDIWTCYVNGKLTFSSSLSFQVWFQNRRAKWRRQEKLEVSSIKVQDATSTSSLLSFGRSPASSLGSPGLQLDPWLSTPITTSASLQSLPGFIASSQGLPTNFTPSPPPAIPSSLPTSFLNPSALGHGPHLPHMGSMCPPASLYQCSADPRNSSIASLRMKAKEHIQSIGKTWWCCGERRWTLLSFGKTLDSSSC